MQKDGFHWLLPRAHNFINDLIVEFRLEENIGTKCWILELLAESKAIEGFEILKENLLNEIKSFRMLAIRGMRNLDTKEARTELFKSGLQK